MRVVVARLDAAAPPTAADPPDVEALYTLYAPFIFRVLRGMGVHESLVPDAVQDVFIVVHRRYAEFDHGCHVRTWLYEIAYRTARDYRRKHRRATTLFVADDREHAVDRTPARDAEQTETLQLLARLLDRLDDDKREVLVLTDMEGLTAPEIAQITGASLTAVYSRLRRARIEFNQLVAVHRRRAK